MKYNLYGRRDIPLTLLLAVWLGQTYQGPGPSSSDSTTCT